uniref:Uncharacterized protein n=1 Tax=Avena sativa TaxID=4498 RepID=A0ACD5YDP5_AVESA
MQGNGPASVLLLPLAALLIAASASPAVGAYSGRVVISSDAAAGTRAGTRYHMVSTLPRLDDEVAPELSWVGSLQGVGSGGIAYPAFDPNKPVCPQQGGCAGKKPGESYHRPCIYKDLCRP